MKFSLLRDQGLTKYVIFWSKSFDIQLKAEYTFFSKVFKMAILNRNLSNPNSSEPYSIKVSTEYLSNSLDRYSEINIYSNEKLISINKRGWKKYEI